MHGIPASVRAGHDGKANMAGRRSSPRPLTAQFGGGGGEKPPSATARPGDSEGGQELERVEIAEYDVRLQEDRQSVARDRGWQRSPRAPGFRVVTVSNGGVRL